MSDKEEFTSIKVFALEDIREIYRATLMIPSGLSDEQIDDLLQEDKYRKRIYRDENRETYGIEGLYEFDWIRSEQTWDSLPREEHLLVHTKNKKWEIA